MLFFIFPLMSFAAERHIAIVIDTSGSMSGSDKPRYTIQLSRIIAELLSPDDKLHVIHFPNGGSCHDGPSSSLSLAFDATNPTGFKQALESHIRYGGGNDFAAPIRTAIQLLSMQREKQRMLLIIADSGGLDCNESWHDLAKIHNSGAVVAAINIGSNAGAFDSRSEFDFTTAALNSEQLVTAVAQVYQKFLGAKKVQTGAVRQGIQVKISPLVSKAFLVVAADGAVNTFVQTSGNPAAKRVDLNYAMGETIGLDGKTRAYRIALLENPASGQWSFDMPGLNNKAGWMLIQDSAATVRFITPPTVTQGVETPIEIELYDPETGQRITDPSALVGLDVSLTIEGKSVQFTDNGQQGDKEAGDGIFTGNVIFHRTGEQQIDTHLENEFLDKKLTLKTKVIDAAWKLEVTSPNKAGIGTPLTLSVKVNAIGDINKLKPPTHIRLENLILRDDGKNGDQQTHDRIYSTTWQPVMMGEQTHEYIPVGGTKASPVSASIEIFGSLEFGEVVPVNFGQLSKNQSKEGLLDLRSTQVKGEFEIQVSTDLDVPGTELQIYDKGEWQTLDEKPHTLVLQQGNTQTWQLRLKAGECPAFNSADTIFNINVELSSETGKSISIPVTAETQEEPWLKCWWSEIIATAIMTIIAIIVMIILHGFISPYRFSSHLGVMLSPEEDMSEGFFHLICTQQGTRSGFYRHAKAYVCQDLRLSGNKAGAVARLQAAGTQTKLQAVAGSSLWRQTADGDWEQLPPEETTVRLGVLYKSDSGGVFFEVRNR